jgi:hypothetical protein
MSHEGIPLFGSWHSVLSVNGMLIDQQGGAQLTLLALAWTATTTTSAGAWPCSIFL